MAESTVTALKRFFDVPALTMTELKALTKEERAELADLVFAETGWERQATTAA